MPSLSLKVLSEEARCLVALIEDSINDESDVNLQPLLDAYFGIQQDITHKTDALAYVADDLKAQAEVTQQYIAKLQAIRKRQQQSLEQLKDYLLHLHQEGLIDDRLEGETRKIRIQKNSMPTVELKLAPEHPDFPDEFREVRVEYKANLRTIAQAYKAGRDVSAIADVYTDKHVRF
jgi:hypothetical protein